MTTGTHRRGRLLVFVVVVVIIGATVAYATQRGGTPPAQRPDGLQLQPSHGPIQAAVRITGAHVGTAQQVTFNGISAPFTVQSATEITARVPGTLPPGPVTVKTDGENTTTARFEVTRPNIVFILTD